MPARTLLLLTHLLSLLALAFTPLAYTFDDADAYDWKLRKNTKEIKVFTSKAPDSKYRAIRAEMRVKANVNSLVAMMMDTSTCSRWADACKESKIIEQLSDSEYYLYGYNNIPFPARDRDAVVHIRWEYLPNSGQVIMHGNVTDRGYPLTRAVRVEKARTFWRFTPQKNGTTLVENFAHADPNGPIPPWLVNLLITNSPYRTFSNIRELVESGEFAEQQVAFLP